MLQQYVLRGRYSKVIDITIAENVEQALQNLKPKWANKGPWVDGHPGSDAFCDSEIDKAKVWVWHNNEYYLATLVGPGY